MRIYKALSALAIAVTMATACTPEEIALYESRTGVDLTVAQEEMLLARPTSYTHPNPDVERHHADALAAGWSEAEWPKLSCIVQRESNGLTGVHNRRDPAGGSRGLLQINGTWIRALRDAGLITVKEDLFDAAKNLAAGRWIFENSGWGPWGRSRKCDITL